MFEDGFNAFVAAATQHQGSTAGGFQSCLAVALSQPENAQAGAVGLLRVFSGTQGGADELFRRGPSLGRPGNQPFRRPLTRLPMGFGHMGGDGGMPSLLVRAAMASNPVAPVKTLNDVVGDPDLHFLFDQGVGHRVVMPVNGYVVVDVHPGLLPLRVDITLSWQGL